MSYPGRNIIHHSDTLRDRWALRFSLFRTHRALKSCLTVFPNSGSILPRATSKLKSHSLYLARSPLNCSRRRKCFSSNAAKFPGFPVFLMEYPPDSIRVINSSKVRMSDRFTGTAMFGRVPKYKGFQIAQVRKQFPDLSQQQERFAPLNGFFGLSHIWL